MDAATAWPGRSSKQMAKLEQLTLVLVRTRNPLNIGAVARAMQNFGVRNLRLVAPFETSFREARSAVGGEAGPLGGRGVGGGGGGGGGRRGGGGGPAGGGG